MAKKHEWEEIGEELAQEMAIDSEIVSKELFSQPLPDSEELTEAQMDERVRANWYDETWRRNLLLQLGAKNYIGTVNRAFGVNGNPKAEGGILDG